VTSAPAGDPARLPPSYWRLWAASTISNLGDGVFLVALPLLAARLTRDETAISLVAAAAALPWLLLSLPIGGLIDRADRKRILLAADTFRALLVGGLAIVVALDLTEIWMLWVVALLLGIAEVFFDNTSQAILPAIVEPNLLEKANGRRYAAETVANTFLGTPLGSVLFGAAIWIPFGFQAASFAVAVCLIMPLRGRFDPHEGSTAPRTSLAAEVRDGLGWLWRHRMLRSLAIALGLSNLGFQIPQAVFVLFAQERLGVSERGFGLLLAVMGIGAVLGGLVGDRIVARVGPTAAIHGALVTWICTLLAVGIHPVTWFVALMVAIESLAATTWNVVTVSLRQQVVPPELFGRVNSVYRWFGWGTLPIGSVIGGIVATHLGLRATYFVGAAFVAVALLVAMRQVTTAALARAQHDARARAASGPARALVDDTPVSLERDELLD